MERKKFYISCPNCSRRLLLARENSDVEVECPKCKDIIRIQVSSDKKVNLEIIKDVNEVNTQ